MKMIAKLLVVVFLVVAFGATHTAFAGEYLDRYRAEKALKIKTEECRDIKNHVIGSRQWQVKGKPLSYAQKDVGAYMRRHYPNEPDTERVYVWLVSFAYNGGDPLYAYAMCMDEDPDFLVKDIRDKLALIRKSMGSFASQ